MTPGQKRQSCDRCHDQKLRCTRQAASQQCTRCLRHGAQCVYSAPLSKGRRTGVAVCNLNMDMPLNGNLAGPTPSAELHGTAGTTPAWPSSDFTWPASFDGPCPSSASVSSSTQAPFAFDLDFALPPDDAVATSASGSTHAANAAPAEDVSPAAHVPACAQCQQPSGFPRLKLTSEGRTDAEVCAEHLSRLVARLWPVFHLSQRFEAAQKEHQGPLIVNAAFASATTFLTPPQMQSDGATSAPLPCKALYCTFATSHWLHETLHCLLPASIQHEWDLDQYDPAIASRANSSLLDDTMLGDDMLPPPFSPQAVLEILRDPAVEGLSRSQDPLIDNELIGHLLLACYMLLLRIYGALLDALKRDAISDSLFKSSAEGHGLSLSPSLAAIRLTLVLHLVSYFLQRLRGAVRATMTHWEQGFASSSRSAPVSSDSQLASIESLDSSLMQKLQQLQNELR